MTPVAVPGVECPCPGKPHPEGDIVELRDRLGLAAGARLQGIVLQARPEKGEPEPEAYVITGKLIEGYLLVGVCGWTFVNEDGKPVPVTEDNIRALLLDDFERAYPVADKADELYHVPVIGPLLAGASKPSQVTPTSGSTSARPNGSTKPRKPSKPSSTTTTQTGVTATISV